MNLPQQLQEYLNYPKLQVIDPTTERPKDESVFDPLKQSVLITFLVGLYKETRTKEGATIITHLHDSHLLLNEIFPQEENTLDTIASYAGQPLSVVKEHMIEVANSYLHFFHREEGHAKKEIYLQDLMTGQRNLILTYIPSGLKLGDLMHDETLEDTTHKMQGPISSLMHMIEGNMSKSD